MGLIAQKCFPNTTCVTDRFTPVSILILNCDNASLNSCAKNSLEAYKKSGLNTAGKPLIRKMKP
jgi:hypothetical protein